MVGQQIDFDSNKIKRIKMNIIDENWKTQDNMYCCPYCFEKYKRKAICTHIWRTHTEDGKNHTLKVQFKKGQTAWNKGLKKDADSRVLKYASSIRKFYIDHDGSFTGKHHSQQVKEILRKKGGYRIGSGRGKSGWYKGIWCDSSYELVWVIYNLEHSIPFQRNTQGFHYSYNGRNLKYFPDFIQNNLYIEIKGFLRPEDLEKFKSFPHSLIILYRDDLNREFDYVVGKYGRDFINLYDDGNIANVVKAID